MYIQSLGFPLKPEVKTIKYNIAAAAAGETPFLAMHLNALKEKGVVGNVFIL